MYDDGRAGLFPIRIPSSRDENSKITNPLHKITDEGKLEKGNWDALLPTTKMTAITFVRVNGVKLTRQTANPDLEVMRLFYYPLSDISQPEIELDFDFAVED